MHETKCKFRRADGFDYIQVEFMNEFLKSLVSIFMHINVARFSSAQHAIFIDFNGTNCWVLSTFEVQAT